MDRYGLQRSWKEWYETMIGSRSRDLFIFLFFLAVSTGFWLLQTLDETFETEIVVPLQLTNIPDGVVITTPLPDEARVVVRDRGTTLLRYWHRSTQPIEFSFSEYDQGKASGHVRIPQADALKRVQESLPGIAKIQAVHPDILEFFYNHGLNTNVPVRVVSDIKTASSIYLYDIITVPSQVKVYGASSLLDTLQYVVTMPFKRSDLKENLTVELPIRSIRGAKIEPERVKATARVDFFVENSVEIPVVSLNFPGDRELRTFPSSVKVSYTVGYERSKELTSDKFVCVVTYEEILELQKHGASRIPIRLKSIPEGITSVRFEPDEVDFLVETIDED